MVLNYCQSAQRLSGSALSDQPYEDVRKVGQARLTLD